MAKKYYLFGRNTSTNKLEAINIESGRLYSNNYNYEYDNKSFQEIDLYTMSYSSKGELKKNTNLNLDDFFVVSKGNDETIYYPIILCNDEMSPALKKVAEGYNNDYLDGIYVDIILDEFSAKIYSDIEFYKFVITNYPDLYSDFIKNFNEYKTSSNLWSKSFYPVIRQMVESFNKYKQSSNSYDNIETKKVDFLDNKYDIKKSGKTAEKINVIYDFLSEIDHDFIVIDNQSFIINREHISCDEAEEKQLDSIDPKIKRLFYLISTFNFVNRYENQKYADLKNTLVTDLMNYLRNDKKLNIVYAFTLLYNKCKKEKRNINYGKK